MEYQSPSLIELRNKIEEIISKCEKDIDVVTTIHQMSYSNELIITVIENKSALNGLVGQSSLGSDMKQNNPC